MFYIVADWVRDTGYALQDLNWAWGVVVVVFAVPILLAILVLRAYESIRGEQWE